MNQTSEQPRILAVSLSTHGFGYALMEDGGRLIDYGNARIKKDKNARSLAHIERLVVRNLPDLLVLHDVKGKGTRRAPRIKRLHRQVVALSKERELKVMEVSGRELRRALLDNERGTKYEMAELLAKRFPDELASRLPPKRRDWTSEDARIDIFDAVGLAISKQQKRLYSLANKYGTKHMD